MFTRNNPLTEIARKKVERYLKQQEKERQEREFFRYLREEFRNVFEEYKQALEEMFETVQFGYKSGKEEYPYIGVGYEDVCHYMTLENNFISYGMDITSGAFPTLMSIKMLASKEEVRDEIVVGLKKLVKARFNPAEYLAWKGQEFDQHK